jgi:hypothetical protein
VLFGKLLNSTLVSLFFWPEQYRRTGGVVNRREICREFRENPVSASAGLAVGRAESVPDGTARSNVDRAGLALTLTPVVESYSITHPPQESPGTAPGSTPMMS